MPMTCLRALPRMGLAMLLLALASPWASSAQDKANAHESDAPAKTSKTARPDRPATPGSADPQDAPAQGLGAFGRVLPIGEKNIDVKIPSFRDGIPSSTVRATSMTRVDDENMQMESMDIPLYGQSHEKDVRIQLLTAAYHMPSQILSSDRRSRVSRDDFKLEGDTMIFDTRTGQGKMAGNVRMVIFDADSLTAATKGDAPQPGGKPAADGKAPPKDKNQATPPAPAAAPSQPTPSSAPHEKK